jgi:deoxyribonuclease-4
VASGYDLTTDEAYRATFAAFGRIVGFDRLRVMHGNDSKRPCGSRVDRHEHIGDGCLGLDSFRRLFQDRRLEGLPILIETEKSVTAERAAGPIVADPLDVRNLETLRALRASAASPRGKSAEPRFARRSGAVARGNGTIAGGNGTDA